MPGGELVQSVVAATGWAGMRAAGDAVSTTRSPQPRAVDVIPLYEPMCAIATLCEAQTFSVCSPDDDYIDERFA